MLFLVCFDLGADKQEQLKQASYWLDYLQSLLCPSSFESDDSRNDFLLKWRVILVGLRWDLQKPTEVISTSIQQCKQQWSNLPLYERIFHTSKEDSKSVQQLWEIVGTECNSIMGKYTTQIPTAYLIILETLQSEASAKSTMFIHTNEFLQSLNSSMKSSALRYLHSVGDIILLHDGLICTQPASISLMMAKFVSPDSVQQNFPHIATGNSVILTTEHVGRILLIDETDPKLLTELQIMSSFGICYQLPATAKNPKSSFMFPSLAQEAPRMLIFSSIFLLRLD